MNLQAEAHGKCIVESTESGATVKKIISDFIVSNFLFGDASKAPSEAESLIATGIVDSTGILELIGFIEENFGIKVGEDETVPKNLDSIANLTRFVGEKISSAKNRP